MTAHVGALFEGDQVLAGKIVIVGTLAMWLVQLVSLIKGSDIKTHSKADKDAFGAEEEAVDDTPAFNVWGIIAGNQLEQWPLSLAVYVGALLVGGDPTVVMYGFIVYIVLRLLFIVAYLTDVTRTVIAVRLNSPKAIGWAWLGLSTVATLVVGIVGICGPFEESVFEEIEQKRAAKALFVVTFIMFFVNNLALSKGLDDPASEVDDSPFNYWARIANNQLEQWPLTLAVFWGALFVGANGFYVMWAGAVYLTLRMFFIVAYLQDITPGRSIVFALSQLVTLAVAILGVRASTEAAVGGASIFNDGQTTAAATLMILTFAMWLVNFVSLVVGSDPATHSEADKKAFKLVVEEDPPFNYWGRIAANQLEQFPLSLAVYWTALIFGGPAVFVMWGLIVYYILRVAFIIAYLKDISPGRSVIFLLSQVVTLSVGVAGVLGAFGVV